MEPQINGPQGAIESLKKTPLTKYLAMALFIILPFVGGWIGYQYALKGMSNVANEKIFTDKSGFDIDLEELGDFPLAIDNTQVESFTDLENILLVDGVYIGDVKNELMRFGFENPVDGFGEISQTACKNTIADTAISKVLEKLSDSDYYRTENEFDCLELQLSEPTKVLQVSHAPYGRWYLITTDSDEVLYLDTLNDFSIPFEKLITFSTFRVIATSNEVYSYDVRSDTVNLLYKIEGDGSFIASAGVKGLNFVMHSLDKDDLLIGVFSSNDMLADDILIQRLIEITLDQNYNVVNRRYLPTSIELTNS